MSYHTGFGLRLSGLLLLGIVLINTMVGKAIALLPTNKLSKSRKRGRWSGVGRSGIIWTSLAFLLKGGSCCVSAIGSVIDSREASFIAIIDKPTDRIVWRLGPDYWGDADRMGKAVANASPHTNLSLATPRPVDQTSGQHDAHIIPEGLPGAGNLLVFDNEGPSGFPPNPLSLELGSRILEIDPQQKTIVWQYSGIDSDQPPWDFYSSFISSARRLSNGNTLIDEGMNGRLFQVTPSGEIVWEYINPYYGRQNIGFNRDVSTNWVYRAQPIPYDWAPEGTPHQEGAIAPPENSKFRLK